MGLAPELPHLSILPLPVGTHTEVSDFTSLYAQQNAAYCMIRGCVHNHTSFPHEKHDLRPVEDSCTLARVHILNAMHTVSIHGPARNFLEFPEDLVGPWGRTSVVPHPLSATERAFAFRCLSIL